MSYYSNDKYRENKCARDEGTELLQLIVEDFSEDSVANVLSYAGLTQELQPRLSGDMENLVFKHGESNETYSPEEIRFIEQVDRVFVYPDITKSLNRGNMDCRAIAARFECGGYEAIKSCICFEKIVDKALDGFNVFLFITETGAFFGCRIFDKTGKHTCTLTSPITHEEEFDLMIEEIEALSDIGSFTDYYVRFYQAITDGQVKEYDYDDIMTRRRGIQLPYLDSLDEIGHDLGIDMTKEKEEYQSYFDVEPERPFETLFEEAYESLAFIKSNRINTYELLFEVDEILQQAETAEIESRRFTQMSMEDLKGHDIREDEEAKTLLDDPEEMVKLLKKRRGI